MTGRLRFLLAALLVLSTGLLLLTGTRASSSSGGNDFAITSTYIEACSCDMFCPCYFNTHSTSHVGMGEHHSEEHFCRANLVFKVDQGHYKDVKLDGAKVWLSSDLGSDWSTGANSWMVVTYDPSVTAAQKAALEDIVKQLYSAIPFKSVKSDTAAFAWNIDTKSGVATAKRDDGKGEVVLERWKGDNPNEETVLKNVHYWGAQSNDGFRMWKSKREMYDAQGQKFDYSGTNGFLITIHYSGMPK